MPRTAGLTEPTRAPNTLTIAEHLATVTTPSHPKIALLPADSHPYYCTGGAAASPGGGRKVMPPPGPTGTSPIAVGVSHSPLLPPPPSPLPTPQLAEAARATAAAATIEAVAVPVQAQPDVLALAATFLLAAIPTAPAAVPAAVHATPDTLTASVPLLATPS